MQRTSQALNSSARRLGFPRNGFGFRPRVATACSAFLAAPVEQESSTTSNNIMSNSRHKSATHTSSFRLPSSNSSFSPRFFSSTGAALETLTPEQRKKLVLDAVQKHLYDREEDIKKEMEEASAQDAKAALAKKLETLRQPLSMETTWDHLGFDEFDRVEVLLEVEEAFNYTIPDEDADKIAGVQEAFEYLEKHAVTA
ncbi:unnamed protein product [Amoebophrya sp. A25]|nr:unnamed protein product [Amoebophrya sp. A25]|eukprot:GSA25T00010347001.1